ncbi:chloride channel protein [Mucilaginibacter boryungensis]|uniref:Chloride channel protein n=1 Tax=Mucilaginibacter boryungensis TaxID=768480 RepID=A0ABR9XF14_9SPHI|nr:chloride channel protein [Mucilaginibacter boryungensis]MBE9665599.1 chloride channel protein [Mucilaginibacter boryungensis]
MKTSKPQNTIPVSPILASQMPDDSDRRYIQRKRLLRVSIISVAVAIAISFIAKVLVSLINLVTNISFFGSFNLAFHSPANNHLGYWVIIIPAIGGVLVGLMALYGSKAIRGHGIPEAMEQILTNKSTIKPAITFLKPISSAIAIGTGGPFGAEGPIIATGGALGSTIGQLFKITANERKVILAAGATAGMSAIFGTPIAAVFLAIELLLFEFSPWSILPVALACITGAAGHHLLFDTGAVFPMPNVAIPSNQALAIYSCIGIVTGFLAMGLTKIVYWIEDMFEHLPIHWMWWPAIGGLAVGIIGYFAPHTLGVGYDNITGVLSGKWPLTLILTLCFFKFLSWAIALGSGTSGGTLAPLLTIGGASGAVIGTVILGFFPDCGLSIPMSALIGMSAMFAGASRAYLTSITFALEATMQSHALLPLLGACTGSYLVSFFLMENTIMTEKIARRGVYTPDTYEADPLQKIKVAEVMETNAILGGTNLKHQVKTTDTLRKAVELMAKTDSEILQVVDAKTRQLTGTLTYKDILKSYKTLTEENEYAYTNLSLKRRRLKMMILSKQLLNKSDK